MDATNITTGTSISPDGRLGRVYAECRHDITQAIVDLSQGDPKTAQERIERLHDATAQVLVLEHLAKCEHHRG